MNGQAPAGWFPDPFHRHEHRYWDGVQWTEHVGSEGQQSVDAPLVAPPKPSVPTNAASDASSNASAPNPASNKRVQRQLQSIGVGDSTKFGGGTLFTEPVLVVNQKAKLFERRAVYDVFNQHGQKVGGVRELGVGMFRAVLSGRGSSTTRLQIVDADGQPALTLTRPATTLKPKVVVTRVDGTLVGQIAQENFGLLASMFGGRFNIRFRMETGGKILGTINSENWRDWDFTIQDPDGNEVGRITKTWAGFAKERFTTADNYVLEIYRPLEDPLRSLVVSAALVVDTVLKQGTGERRSS